ncbi:DUF6894 family protein [Methylobacterium sp. E-045]|uniref:DUF6894 family protein n=1 Tax=Methylobacterium sp. E-045 TaxID=2836575 RepID=UPI001FBBB71C|nr:hypothetical protein [Methylobacterium sp. E-045]MCJ2132288.1 hypothetical protein [Methylobacterium sp. E-045]
MPRYYFHLRDGSNLHHDPEGGEFESIEAARSEAVGSAKLLISEIVKAEAPLGLALRLIYEITSETGEVMVVMFFREVAEIDTRK